MISDSKTAGQRPSRWVVGFLLALAYAASGWLSHWLNWFPGVAAPIWLPAGIAFGGLLVFGLELWPAVWLGALVATLLQLLPRMALESGLLLASVVATGIVVQSWLGVLLALRLFYPSRRPRFQVAFIMVVLLSGCGVCVISPTVGSLALWWLGQLPADQLLDNWFSWWVGDTMGLIVGANVVLSLWGEPASLWRPRRMTVALPLLLVTLVMFGVFSLTAWLDQRLHAAEFERQSAVLASAIRSALGDAEDATSTLNDFMRSPQGANRAQFFDIAAPIHSRHPSLQALEWAPLVPHAALAAHQAAVRSEGFRSYRVFEKDVQGARQTVAQREQYFPVQFIHPMAGNELALGFDLASEPVRNAALQRARQTQRFAVSQRIRLVQEREDQFGVLGMVPKYEPTADGQRMVGVTLSVVRVGRLLQAAVKGLETDRIAWRLDDLDAAASEQWLYGVGHPMAHSVLRVESDLAFGGRRWRLVFEPTAEYLTQHRATHVWVIYAGALTIMFLLCCFLLVLSGRAAQVEELVSERTRQLELARSEAERASTLLGEAVSSIAQGFTIYDENDRLVTCNEAYKRFYETSRDMLVPGNTFEQIVRTGAERGQYAAALGRVDDWVRERVRQHQAANGVPIEQLLDDGRWLLIVEYRTPSGYIAGNRIDITNLKNVSSALMERNAQLNALFAVSPDGLLAMGEDNRVQLSNPAVEAMLGAESGALIGLGEGDLDAWLRKLTRHPDAFHGVSRYFDADIADLPLLELERPNPIMLRIEGIHSQTRSLPHILYLRDVTRESEVDRMKSEFLSHAAHELRTPMTSIYGFSELLLDSDLNEAMRREMVETIHRQTKWLVEIINELLDLSRIEARRGMDIHLADVDLGTMLRETVLGLDLDAERWPVKFVSESHPLSVRTDAGKLRHAVTNILANARKYSPQGGVIEVGWTCEAERVGITIADHGMGMTEQQLARVGERFWRADTSGSTPGTGLGVAMVLEILKLLGGRLELQSQAGQGTQVTLWLPFTAMPPVPA